ncbi:MAG: sigma-70 family RNA polymerase sigma factor [Actinomycetota bacterium]
MGTFEAFFSEQKGALLRALYVMTGSRDEAADICQDAFLAVWERWDRVGSLDDPTGYLFRTAMNRHRSHLRRARVATRRLLDRTTVRDQLSDAVDRADVARALQQLSGRRREAIVLTELLQFDSEHAATIMGVASSTVRRLAQDARADLERLLEAGHEPTR